MSLQAGKTLVQSETGPDLKVYTILWIIDEVIEESNERFVWKKVRAHWSGFGTMPLWHKEPLDVPTRSQTEGGALPRGGMIVYSLPSFPTLAEA